MTVIQKERVRPAAEAWVGPAPNIETAPDSITELLSLAKTEIAWGERSMRRAAEYVAAAQAKGAKQTLIAKELGKSQPWVARLLRWQREGCVGDAFGPGHHRERVIITPGNIDLSDEDRARLKSARSAAWKKDRKFLLDMFMKEMDMRVRAQEETERLRHEFERRSHSFSLHQAAKSQTLCTADRKRIIKLLGMLGSGADGEVVNAARMAEDLRDRLGLTWNDIIVAPKA
jgi:hypothetical protein